MAQASITDLDLAPPGTGHRLELLEREIARLERVADRSAPVLVVDDMQTMRLLLAQVMKSTGFTRVHRAAEGESALKIMLDTNCDLCLADWNMPRMDGLELLMRVRRDPAINDVVFIMITAETLDKKVMRAAEEKQDAYLTKPVSAEKLTRRLELILEHRLTTARALRLEALGKAENAVEEFMAAAHNRPRARWPMFGLAGLYGRLERFDEAERCYERILELDPEADAALVEIGRIKEKLGQISEGRELYSRAMKNSPMFFKAYDALAESMLDQGEEEAALEVLQDAMAKQGTENAARQKLLGRLSYRLGLFAEAEEAYQRSMELNPTGDAVEENLRLARARLAQGNTKAAIGLLNKVAELTIEQRDPSDRLEALMLKGGAHAQLKELTQAAKVFDDIADPQFWPTGQVPFDPCHYHREVGGIYLNNGLHQEALDHFATSIRLDHQDAENLAAIEAMCNNAGMPQLARQAQEKMAQTMELEVEQCSRRGLKLVARGNFRAAMAEYQRGLDIDPNSGRLQFNVGKLWQRLEQIEEALRAMIMAAKLGMSRGDWELVVETARFFATQGHQQQAKGLLNQVIARQPDLAPAQRLLSDLCISDGPRIA